MSGFPIIKCYERSPGPGEVWRSDRTHEDTSSHAAAAVTMDMDMDVDNEDGYPFETFEGKKEEEPSQFPTEYPEKKKMKVGQEEEERPKYNCYSSSKQGEKSNIHSGLWTNGTK